MTRGTAVPDCSPDKCIVVFARSRQCCIEKFEMISQGLPFLRCAPRCAIRLAPVCAQTVFFDISDLCHRASQFKGKFMSPSRLSSSDSNPDMLIQDQSAVNGAPLQCRMICLDGPF